MILEKNEREDLLPAKNTQIQLVVDHAGEEEDTIDLGRVLHNARVKARIFAWVLVLCMLVGVCAPLLLYQFQKPELTVSSVVTLRYSLPNPAYERAQKNGDLAALRELEPELPVDDLTAPDGEPLDLSVVTSAPVLSKALDGLALSKPVTIENLRNNLTVSRILTTESSRAREVLSGLAEAKNAELYNRLESTEMKYQNRFIVSLTNGFGDADSTVKYELTAEELTILLNRILDAYNSTMVQQYADVRLPEDKISLIDTAELDLPEVLDALGAALDDLVTYCDAQPETAKAYRSWQTGMSLNEWTKTIRTVRSVSVDYLDAYVYAKGLMRDRDAVALTYRYRLRTLQSDLDKINETIASTSELLKNYKNNEVYVSMQESDAARTTQMTTAYYNEMVLLQQANYTQAAKLRTEIAETRNKLDRLSTLAKTAEIADAEAETLQAVETAKNLYQGVRNHMTELFASSLFTTYSEHSAPQGEEESFLKASAKKIVIGAVAGLVIGCACWFLAALYPELRHKDKEKADAPQAGAEGKEAAEV